LHHRSDGPHLRLALLGEIFALGLNGLDADRSARLFDLKLTGEASARIIQGRLATVGKLRRRLPEQLISGKVLDAA
jgi:hypothetical protein